MKSNFKIGGPKSAKRKTQVRKYYENAYMQSSSYSDPFIEDEAEYEKCEFNMKPAKLSFRSSYKCFSSENEDDNCVDPDGILVRPNLEEADKFIASLKLPKKMKVEKDDQLNKDKFIRYTISSSELDAFKIESEKLEKMIKKQTNEESEDDDNVI